MMSTRAAFFSPLVLSVIVFNIRFVAAGREVCSLSSLYGRCKNRIPRFSYRPKYNTCLSFTYSGCGGNGNNFHTRDDCLQTCRT